MQQRLLFGFGFLFLFRLDLSGEALGDQLPAALLGDFQLRAFFAQDKIVLAVIEILFYLDFHVVTPLLWYKKTALL